MADYNGVTLPDIPSDLAKEYGFNYSFIFNLTEAVGYEYYVCAFTTLPLFHNQTNSTLIALDELTLKQFIYCPSMGHTEFTEAGNEVSFSSGETVFENITHEIILWSDHDILDSETNEVFFPSSVKPLYYYNGVRLPQLPSDVDVATYSNTSILFVGDNEYVMYCMSQPLKYDSDGVFVVENTDIIALSSDPIFDTEWERMSEANSGTNKVYLTGLVLLWSNHDVLTSETNEVYFKGTQAYSEEETASITLKTLCDLGDAIREVTGDSTLRTPKEMIAKVKEFSGGGGDLDALIDGSITEVVSNATVIRAYGLYYSNLTKGYFPNVIHIKDKGMSNCEKVTELFLPNCTTIFSCGLQACRKLTKLILPSVSITSKNSFNYCDSLAILDFHKDVIIGSGSFGNNSALKALILRFEDTSILSGASEFSFSPIASGTGYIYVPRALVDSYKTATNWTTYATQFRALEDYTVDGTTTGELDESKI